MYSGSHTNSSTRNYIKNNRYYSHLKTFSGNINIDYITITNDTKDDEYDNLNGYLVPKKKTYIPKNIYQTHKSMEYIKSKPEIYKAVQSWQIYNDYNYRFFTDLECEEFIKTNFDRDVLLAYNKCPLAVMKADLWRYCIIYKNGGIYADTDTVCKIHPNFLIKNKCLLAIVPENDDEHLCQWIFAAPPKSPILKYVIDMVVLRILSIPEIKGEHVIHYLTGPGAFTAGIEKYLNENLKDTYDKKSAYVNYKDDCLYVLEPNHFHKNAIVHLFSGQHFDGWKKERDALLTD
jgi:mannosyltransferase OCH1-like enzyme